MRQAFKRGCGERKVRHRSDYRSDYRKIYRKHRKKYRKIRPLYKHPTKLLTSCPELSPQKATHYPLMKLLPEVPTAPHKPLKKPYKIKPLYRTEKQGTPGRDLQKLRAKLLKDPAKNALALNAISEELAAIGIAK